MDFFAQVFDVLTKTSFCGKISLRAFFDVAWSFAICLLFWKMSIKDIENLGATALLTLPPASLITLSLRLGYGRLV